ncbi:ASCH domain-containing protein [Aquisalibacillus elongatus]|uniref:ASC-1-like (ASCH) protein n=1 Tax=Aquisalibacillus elongatus TaxID=485577 RepID=A0A3N5AYQ2_9BACI|nr:ASCH domain-containing protein [Aquisalibacillus elongatus]RPF50386.1 ASC-1-like (ASCH) protein [Aquisalibacillus elongatus]
MNHEMGLYDTPFNSIKSCRKTVEVRLNDEKRRKLSVGDTITFTRVPEYDETLSVEVVALREYPTFKEMYESIPASDFDTVGESIDVMVEQTYQIYSPDQERQWGTLAITVQLID